jgi:CBS domain containing-hemolysin-like protein
MTLLILFFLLSIIFSFLCSIWEAVILSITPAYVKRLQREGSSIAPLLQSYKEDIDRPLSAILTLNTIAHTVGAIGVGAQAGKLFGSTQLDLGFTSLSYESIIAALMTLAILILSEIIPKTIGANMWQDLAPFTMRSLNVLIWILKPLVWISQRITQTLKKDKERSVLSRADFAAMAQAGEEEGTLDSSESTIIQNLMRLEKLKARDIMTPRNVMVVANEEQTLEEFWQAHQPLPYSRIPVFQKKSDYITGMFLKDHLLEALAGGQNQKVLKEIRRDILHVNDTDPLPKLLDQLVNSREHIAIVYDEYGSVVGLVTMEDIFETIMGLEIVDETDTVENLQHYARQRWEARAEKRLRNK